MPFWIHCFLFCVIILYQVHLVSSWLAISIHIFLVPSTSLYFKLLSIVSSFNLTQVVSEPTHVCIKYLILHSQWSCFSYLYTINCLCIQSFTTIPPLCKCRSLWTTACVHYLTSQTLDKVNYEKSLALFPCRVCVCCWIPGLCWLGLSVTSWWYQYLPVSLKKLPHADHGNLCSPQCGQG